MSDIGDRLESFSFRRQGTVDYMRAAGRRSNVHGLVEVDVTEARRRIQTIKEETGESFVIRGTTNRNPEDADIEVDITDGPDSAAFDTRTVEDWSNAGTWTASFSASDVSTGSYTVEVDDGKSTDTVTFSVIGQRTDEQVSEAVRLAEEVERLRHEAERLREETDELREGLEETEEENQRLRDELN